jgi:hypothetical protein
VWPIVAKLPPKKEVADALLEGPSVYVHLDPRCDTVVVPKWLGTQSQLVLQVGLNMAVTIPDLEVGDDGITCTLSFNRSPFWCFLPWVAIYALVGEDGRGMIWPDDIPPEHAKANKPALSVVAKKGAAKKKPKKSKPQPEGLSAVKPMALAAAPPPDGPPAEEPPPDGLLAAAPPPDGPLAAAPPAEEPPAEELPAKDENDRPKLRAVPDKKGGKKQLPPYLRIIK